LDGLGRRRSLGQVWALVAAGPDREAQTARDQDEQQRGECTRVLDPALPLRSSPRSRLGQNRAYAATAPIAGRLTRTTFCAVRPRKW
jgi:hypothetical protein